jgi:4-amino-4-deoxy-L-arabinose transferase-like glycosyltransferase
MTGSTPDVEAEGAEASLRGERACMLLEEKDLERPDGPAKGALRQTWLHLALAILVVIGLRLPYCSQVVINWDESIYLVVGQSLARGDAMYVGAWDHKGPVLLLMFQMIVGLVGESICAVRVITTLYLLVTMAAVHLVALRLFPGPFAGAAALYYGLFFCDRRYGGLASNGELFMMLPAILAVWCALVYVRSGASRGGGSGEPCPPADIGSERGSLGWLAMVGALCAMAGLIKASAADTAVLSILLILAWHLRTRDNDWRLLLREAAATASGGLAVVGAALLGFLIRGNLGELVDTYLVFNRSYVSTFSVADAWAQWGAFLHWAVLRDHLTIIALCGLVIVLSAWRRVRKERWKLMLVLTLAGLSFLGVIMGRNLFFHYYLQMALPFGLLVAFALSTLRIRWADASHLMTALLMLNAAIVLAPSRVAEQRRVALSEDAPAVVEVSGYIREHSSPEDTLFVFGGEPVIYYLADRRAPTRFFFWVHQVDRYAELLDSVETVAGDLRREPPLWIVHHVDQPLPGAYQRLLDAQYRAETSIGSYVLWRSLSR